ncbi:MAG: Fic family protein [bacterium]
MTFNREQPYNDLPPLFPDKSHWETVDVYKQLSNAHRALAELKGRLSAIPNQKIFINTLTLQEAKDSSSIENVFTTNDKLFKAFTSPNVSDPHTTEVLRYGISLVSAFEMIKKKPEFTIDLIEKIYREIKDETDGIRDHQVRVGNAFKTTYTPPCCKTVLVKKMANWFKYSNGDHPIDPLVKLAVLHYQFEAIHPFRDGNGRAGRVLNVLYLTAQHLIDEPVLYLSKYINEYKTKYYKHLQNVTEKGDWETWIIYMLKAVEETAGYTLDKVLAIISLFDDVKEKVQRSASDIYSYELIEVIFTQVYSKYAFLEERKIASRNTASKYLNRLVDLGILEKEKIRNEFIFKNVALYDLFKND